MSNDIWLSILGTLFTIMTGVVIAAWRQINALRNNDMHELRERLVRIETKQDLHLQWHLSRPDSS